MTRKHDTDDTDDESTPTLEAIGEWLDEEYNRYMEIFVWDDRVRLTNGSAAHYVDIYPEGERFKLHGERYGDRIKRQCEAERGALLTELSTAL